MNRKLFRVITVVLAVLIVGQLLNLALQIHSDVYHYSYDEDTFLYTIQDGRYSELPAEDLCRLCRKQAYGRQI